MNKFIKVILISALSLSLFASEKPPKDDSGQNYFKLINEYSLLNKSIFQTRLRIDIAENEKNSDQIKKLNNRIAEKQTEQKKIKELILALKKPNETIVYIDSYEDGDIRIRERHPEIPSDEELKKKIEKIKKELRTKRRK